MSGLGLGAGNFHVGGMLRPEHLHEPVTDLMACHHHGLDAHDPGAMAELVHDDPEQAREIQVEAAEEQVADEGFDPSQLTPEQVAVREETQIGYGLTDKAAAERLERYGRNELDKPPRPTFFMLFVLELTSFIIILLIGGAIASIIVNATGNQRGDWLSYTTGMAIFILVIINAGIAAYTEAQAGDALDALANMSQASIDVLRGGQAVPVETLEIVRGDIVVLGTGDVVPADMRLIEADDLKVSEMALTGEPDDVHKIVKIKPPGEKLTPDNMVFSGCNVTNGKGRGIVVDTGMETRIGRIAQLMVGEGGGKKCGCLPDTSGSATPLQINVERLGARIGVMAIVICIVVFFIGGFLGTEDPNNRDSSPWIYMILIAVTLAVAAIPEGIPLCVTISLAIGCRQMVDKHVLVRKIAAVETLGSASVICSDKTGTLTEGKMTMTQMWSGGTPYDVSGQGFDPTVGTVMTKQGSDARSELGVRSTLLAALLCCNTTLNLVEDEETGRKKWEPKGNSSEAPIVVAARKVGFPENVAEGYPRVMEVPFSSSRKMMMTVSNVTGKPALCDGGMPFPGGTQYLTVVKGAPNYIIELCEQWLKPDGRCEPLQQFGKDDILRTVDMYSSEALRVLAIAVRPMPQLPFNPMDENLTADYKFDLCRQNLILLGLVASIDPARAGVAESVEDARRAGIRVVMITGDYLKTASAIAKNVRILQERDDVTNSAVDCERLRPGGQYLREFDLDNLTSRVRVFARAKPEDKLEIVRSLQRQGQVSAMTGDGVNDAPALNQADIGVAMGIQGTEVAKGASDMILMDDNFVSIVRAVEKGRAIYAGIQKFVAFIMSVHIAEVIQIFICVVAGFPLMRTPLQILFLILVTDLPPSIALGMEPGERDILKEPPRPKDEPVVLGWMWVNIFMNGIILSVIIIGIYLWSLTHYCDGHVNQKTILDAGLGDGIKDAQTVAFISLVFSENVRAYVARSFDKPVCVNLCGNPQMLKAVLVAQVAMFAAVLIPFFSDQILGLTGLKIGWWGWLVSLLGPVLCLILCELCKPITRFQMHRYREKLAQERAEEMEEFEDGDEDDDDDETDDEYDDERRCAIL